MRVARVRTRREVGQAWSRANFLVARADHDAFGELMALSDMGKVRFAGERYGRRGERYAAFEVSHPGRGRRATTKGSIRIGKEFFTLALRDYRDWKSMWWREAIQNAVDAKAKIVECSVERERGGMRVFCDDDGKGMSEDVLLNKFLVLGATTKEAEQAAITMRGGFGKAKELLVLPWLEWRITSGSISVVGAGAEYRVEQVAKRKGTRLEVLMPHDNSTQEILAYNFIKKCNLPGVSFVIDSDPGPQGLGGSAVVYAELKPGRKIREFRDNDDRLLATLHHYKKKAAVPQRLLVRAQGLMMFGIWVSEAVSGQLILELKAPSVELLTANRDGFSDRTILRWGVEDYVNTLAADTTSALKRKTGIVRKKYYGRGGRTAATDRSRYTAALLQESVGDLDPEGPNGQLSKKQLDALGRGLKRASGELEVKHTTVYGRPSTPGLAGIMLGGTRVGGSTDFQAALTQLAWEPDFYLVNENEGFRVPKRFTPEGMSAPVLKLARLWTELCRFVLIQLGCRETFGVGFVFSDDSLAEYVHEDGENWLLFDPLQPAARTLRYARGGRITSSALPPGMEQHGFDSKRGKTPPTYNIKNKDDLRQLYALAIHECTHMASGIAMHNEAFAYALTLNMRETMDKWKQVAQIAKAVGAEAIVRPREDKLYSAEDARNVLHNIPYLYENFRDRWELQRQSQELAWALRSLAGRSLPRALLRGLGKNKDDIGWIFDEEQPWTTQQPSGPGGSWVSVPAWPVTGFRFGNWVWTANMYVGEDGSFPFDPEFFTPTGLDGAGLLEMIRGFLSANPRTAKAVLVPYSGWDGRRR
jgi:hypothetical protein